MRRRENPPIDIVDDAVDAIRETPIPVGPPQALRSRLVAAGNDLDAATLSHITYERRMIVRRTTQASVAAIVLLIALGWASGFLFQQNRNTLLADVVKRIQTAKSATWTTVLYEQAWNRDGSKTWLERTTWRSYYKNPGKLRTERPDEHGQVERVQIDDAVAGKHVELEMKTRRARTIDRTPLSAVEQKSLSDPLTQLRQRLDGDSTSLGKKRVGGREAVGFRVLQVKSSPDSSADLWVDAESGQLLYVLLPGAHKFDPETDPLRNNPPGEAVRGAVLGSIMRDIRFDVNLDDSLFSVEPPKPFSNEVKTKHEPTEKDVIEWFGILAQAHGNVFPPQIQESIEKINEFLQKKKRNRTPAENKLVDQQILADQRLVYPYPISRFVSRLAHGDWHYAGSGVSLGDRSKAIFWYKPSRSKTWRVVYGDLSVKDLAAENLPK